VRINLNVRSEQANEQSSNDLFRFVIGQLCGTYGLGGVEYAEGGVELWNTRRV
jgi:hypothetical protein